jgi:hypothetical protein
MPEETPQTARVPDWAGDGIDPQVPSVARMYDYTLGGSHNFEVDRELIERNKQQWPDAYKAAWSNREFLRRVVVHLARAGVRQFLDIGSGIPTVGNVHEVLADEGADARVVYTDIDPVAVLMSRRILADVPWAVAVRGDFRDLEAILTDPEVTGLLDFSEPVAVLLLALLHVIGDEFHPYELMARLRSRLAPGSCVAISHACSDGMPADAIAAWLDATRQTPTRMTIRTVADTVRFLDGFELLAPGFVKLPLWRPDSGEPPVAEWWDGWGGVGIHRPV